jgi:hypothetical protein
MLTGITYWIIVDDHWSRGTCIHLIAKSLLGSEKRVSGLEVMADHWSMCGQKRSMTGQTFVMFSWSSYLATEQPLCRSSWWFNDYNVRKSQEKECHMHNMHFINSFPRTLFGLSFYVLSFWTWQWFCNLVYILNDAKLFHCSSPTSWTVKNDLYSVFQIRPINVNLVLLHLFLVQYILYSSKRQIHQVHHKSHNGLDTTHSYIHHIFWPGYTDGHKSHKLHIYHHLKYQFKNQCLM